VFAPLITTVPGVAAPHSISIWCHARVVAVPRASIPDATEFEDPKTTKAGTNFVGLVGRHHRVVNTGDRVKWLGLAKPTAVLKHQCEHVIFTLSVTTVTNVHPPVCAEHVPFVGGADTLHFNLKLVSGRHKKLVQVDPDNDLRRTAVTRHDALLLVCSQLPQSRQTSPRPHPCRLCLDVDLTACANQLRRRLRWPLLDDDVDLVDDARNAPCAENVPNEAIRGADFESQSDDKHALPARHEGRRRWRRRAWWWRRRSRWDRRRRRRLWLWVPVHLDLSNVECTTLTWKHEAHLAADTSTINGHHS